MCKIRWNGGHVSRLAVSTKYSLGLDAYLKEVTGPCVVTCKRDAQRKRTDGGSRTHSVPFHVLKYCTTWFRFTAPEAANPASLLSFLLAMVS